MDLLKILLNSSYCLGILTSYPISFPRALSPLLHVGRAISSLQSDALSVECLLSDAFDGSKYLLKNVFALIMPLGGIVISSIIWMGLYACLCRRLSREKKDGRRRRRQRQRIAAENPAQLKRFIVVNFAVTVILILFVTLPSLSRTATSMMVCANFGGETDLRLRDDPEVLCWRTEHLAYFLSAALPAHLLYTIGVPLLGILTLRRHAREGRLWKAASEDPAANVLLFVYSGFERDRYYWEFIIFARKVALSMVVVVTADGQVSGLLGLIILQIASVLQLHSKPYRHSIVNLAESGALQATSLAVYIGLFFFLPGSKRNITLTVLSVVVVGFSVLYLCLLTSVIVQHQCPSVAKRCPVLEDMFGEEDAAKEDAGVEMQATSWVTPSIPETSWKRRFSEEYGADYFENDESGETTWELPANATVIENESDEEFSMNNPSVHSDVYD